MGSVFSTDHVKIPFSMNLDDYNDLDDIDPDVSNELYEVDMEISKICGSEKEETKTTPNDHSTFCSECVSCEYCNDCINCKNLFHCVSCEGCEDGKFSLNCINCKHIENCKFCVDSFDIFDCDNCEDITNCADCDHLSLCENCNDCSNMKICTNCINCNFCELADDCINCEGIMGKSDLKNIRLINGEGVCKKVEKTFSINTLSRLYQKYFPDEDDLYIDIRRMLCKEECLKELIKMGFDTKYIPKGLIS